MLRFGSDSLVMDAVQIAPSERTLRESVVLLCDIVNFSLNTPAEQKRLVRKLWEIAQSDTWLIDRLRTHGPNKVHMWGTGDGFYLTNWEVDVQLFSDLYMFARRVSDGLGSEYPEGLRVALHAGFSDWVFDPDVNPTAVVGTALNEAQRIVGFAAPGQVVFSRAFCHKWVEAGGDLPDATTPPPDQDSDFWVFAKHGEPMYVRFDSDTPSKTMMRLRLVSDLLVAALDQFVQMLPALLEPNEEEREAVMPRISIFRPRRRMAAGQSPMLVATPYRRRPGNLEDPPGRTRYNISSPEASTGIGMAFISGKPSVLPHLPDPRIDLEGYVNEVSSRWKVDKDMVRRWNPKPRCFFALPLGLTTGDESIACVCVDCQVPLSGQTEQELEALAYELHEHVVGTLAPFWSLLN